MSEIPRLIPKRLRDAQNLGGETHQPHKNESTEPVAHAGTTRRGDSFAQKLQPRKEGDKNESITATNTGLRDDRSEVRVGRLSGRTETEETKTGIPTERCERGIRSVREQSRNSENIGTGSKSRTVLGNAALTVQPASAAQNRQRRAPEARGEAKEDQALPEAPEVEKAVLCALLYHPDEGFPIFERNGRPGFFGAVAREWFTQMRSFYREKGHLNPVLFVQHVLENPSIFQKIGGHQYYIGFQGEYHPAEVIPYYLDELREKYVRRQIIMRSFALAGDARTRDLPNLLADMSSSVDDLKRAAGGPNGAQQFILSDLEAFDATHDPLCLVGRRWLVRGGSCLWAGASGIGKSSLAMQIAMYWATGTSIFGWRPVRPLKSVITQAENDEGDVAEQWQGVKKGIAAAGDLGLEEAQALFEKNVIIYRVVGKTGSDFLALLRQILDASKPDLHWLDPMFAFAGCDLLNPEKVGHFLREGLFPLMVSAKCCSNVMHHVGKPKQNGTGSVAEIDTQYLGFGTSEIQNAFRAVNVILPMPEDPGTYKLTLSKRGERAGGKTPMGTATNAIYLQHSKDGICWLQVDEPEPHDQKPKGRQAKYCDEDITKYMSLIHAKKVSELLKKTAERGMSRATFFRIFDKLETAEKVEENQDGWTLKSQKSQKANEPF